MKHPAVSVHYLCDYYVTMMIMYQDFIVFPCLSYSSICSGVDADKYHGNVGYIRSGLFSGSQEVLQYCHVGVAVS